MTTQTRFTPGPWSVGVEGDGVPGYVYCDNALGSAVAIVYGKALAFTAFSREEEKANAALIAASPRLYAALEKFVAHYPMGINPFLDEACIEARAALAQARGEV